MNTHPASTRRGFLIRSTAAAAAALNFPALAGDPKDGSEKETAAYRPDYKATGAKLITDSTPLADGFFMPGEEFADNIHVAFEDVPVTGPDAHAATPANSRS